MHREFGIFLRSLRKRSGLSQTELAKRSALSVRTLAYWESGDYEPRVAELQTVLAVMRATEEEALKAFSLMRSPRGLRQVYETVASTREVGEETYFLPHLGDLLQTLRLRQGMSVSQVSQRLGTSSTTLQRWERLDLLPSGEALNRLCGVLKAFPEEQTALSDQRLRVPLQERPISFDEIEKGVQELLTAMQQPGEPLIDLHVLTLKRNLWFLGQQHPEALNLKAKLDAHYSTWLVYRNRIPEAGAYAKSALELLPSSPSAEIFWALPLCVVAMQAVEKPQRSPENGVRVLRHWIPYFSAPELLLRLYCYMAEYASQAGRGEIALSYLMQAESLLDSVANPAESLHLYRLSQARALVRQGKAGKALEVLPPPVQDNYQQRMFQTYIWAETLFAAGEKNQAQTYLQNAYSEIESYHCALLKPRADRLAQKLG